MKNILSLTILLCLGCATAAADSSEVLTAEKAGTPNSTLLANPGEVLADAVIKASGGDHWPQLKTLDFTFNVAHDEKQLSTVKHHWDLEAKTDTVEWNGKNVTVKLDEKNDAGDAKAAYQRWVNDSYWLLAPLKLRDSGTHIADKGEQQVEGKTYRMLEMTFDHVGLTPGDKYHFYIDPATNLVRRWDYMPTPEKTVSGTWEKYEDFGGLKLATEHEFGGKRIYFTGVAVKN
ncbi:MAG: hypothetical protein QOD99_1487 [Chthoniobacter sp.]|jgi:hypothetical protein|nr:hypothetical protein [Chthoniobacter sp.]